MLVREIMTPDPVTLSLHNSIDLAEKFMRFAHVRHLPVVCDRRLVGIVTHRDLLAAMARIIESSNGAGGEPGKRGRSIEVQTIMQRDIRAIAPDLDVRDAIETMLDHKYGCLPVVEHGCLVGIVTEADFLKFTRLILNTQESREEE